MGHFVSAIIGIRLKSRIRLMQGIYAIMLIVHAIQIVNTAIYGIDREEFVAKTILQE